MNHLPFEGVIALDSLGRPQSLEHLIALRRIDAITNLNQTSSKCAGAAKTACSASPPSSSHPLPPEMIKVGTSPSFQEEEEPRPRQRALARHLQHSGTRIGLHLDHLAERGVLAVE